MALRALNSVAGFSVGETPANVILGNADILANNLSVNGISNLNSLSNVKISGGTAGQFIQTDGTGNLVFAGAPTQAALANGNSDVNIPTANGNITFTVGGVPNIAVMTTTGLVVTGNITPSANITYNLGNNTNRFKDLYLSGTTIVVGNSTIQSSATEIVLTNPLGGQFLVTGTGTSTSNTISDGTSNIQIGASSNVTISVAGNANVLTVTSSGINVAGYINATGNMSLGNANLGNLATANFVNASSNINVTNTLQAGNVRTDNLLYANGQPWDLQEAAGSNYEIQYNINDNFAASANFTYNDSTQQFTVLGNGQFNNANLGNLATANFINVSSNITTGNLTVNNSLTIGSANFSGNLVVPNITINSELSGNTANFSGNVVVPNLTVNLELQANTANFDGNVIMDKWLTVANTANVGNLRTNNLLYANGQPWDLQEAAGANTQIQYNDNNNFGASANFTFSSATNNLALNGNILLGQSGQNQIVPLNNTALEIRGGWDSSTGAVVSLVAGDYANSSNWGKISMLGNVSGNAVAQLEANLINFQPAGGGTNIVRIATLAPDATSTTTGGLRVAGGIGVTGNGYFGGNVVVTGDIANANNISVTNNLNAVVGNFSGNINSLNANLGNLAEANFVNVASNTVTNNLTVNLELSGNTANFTGNVAALNVNAGNLLRANFANVASNTITSNLTVNLQLSGNTANFSGNITAGNANLGNLITANFANIGTNASVIGTMEAGFVRTDNLLYANGLPWDLQEAAGSNYEIQYNIGDNFAASANFTYNDTTQVLTVTGNANITGNLNTPTINSGSGQLNLTSNGYSIQLYANGQTQFPGTVSANSFQGNISGNITIPGAANGVVINDGGLANSFSGFTFNSTSNLVSISGNLTAANANLGNLVIANFITTGEIYNGNSNIIIAANSAVRISSNGLANVVTINEQGANIIGNISANGNAIFGAVQSNTVTAQGGNLTLYAAAGNNYVELRPTGNGHVDVGNFRIENLGAPVASTDAATKGYVDAAVEGLHIHAPSKAATPDTLANITGGTITYNNGTSGVGANLVTTGSFNLIDGVNVQTSGTRILVKNEANTAHNGIYTWANSTTIVRATDFDTPTEMGGGDFTFVQLGTLYNDTGWVMTDPVTTVGTSPIVWVQFSGAGTYTAGPGLTLNGTQFSVNVDNITTEIAGGNVVVKSGIPLSNPNIGTATGTSLDLTGNLIAGNVNSNATITAQTVDVTGNVLANNISANSNITSNNATINLSLSGNTANFTGNVVVSGLTVNTNISGNTANFSGNISALNANLGNLVTANFFTGTLVNGTSNVAIPTANGNVNITAGANTTVVVSPTSANITGNANISGFVEANGNITGGNLITSGNLNVTGVANIGTYAILGNSTVTTVLSYESVTTSSITANQTIASFSVTGVTGVEFLVKGIDSAGSKYSVATVQAVTDGTSVDYATFGTVNLGGYTGSLAVNIVSGYIRLQVTPASSNSTVWTTQYRLI